MRQIASKAVKHHLHLTSGFFLILLVLPGIIAGCKDEIANPDQDIVFPESNVSFGRHVDPLFQQRCAFAGCHGGSNPAAGLNLSSPSYSRLINHQPRLIITGESNNSLLVQRIEGRISPRMPLIGGPLNDNQIRGIKKWIDEGALNN